MGLVAQHDFQYSSRPDPPRGCYWDRQHGKVWLTLIYVLFRLAWIFKRNRTIGEDVFGKNRSCTITPWIKTERAWILLAEQQDSHAEKASSSMIVNRIACCLGGAVQVRDNLERPWISHNVEEQERRRGRTAAAVSGYIPPSFFLQ